jgi:hypothetical protein
VLQLNAEERRRAMAAVSVIRTAARPMAVLGKNSNRSSNCTALAISARGIDSTAPDPA